VNLSYFTLRRLTEELQAVLVGNRVQNAFLVAPHDLHLTLADGGNLLLCASPRWGRITLSPAPQPAGPDCPTWVDRHLMNARIVAIEQPPLERVVFLKLVKRDRLGGEAHYRLISEVMGRYSNVVLVSEPTERILGVLRNVGGRMSRARQVLPGKPYVPPPPLDRRPPHLVTPHHLKDALARQDVPPAKALLYAVAGLDLLTARELLHRAAIQEGVDIVPEATQRLCEEIVTWFKNPPFVQGALQIRPPEGRETEVSVLALQHNAGETLRTCSSVSEAIEALVAEEMQRQAQNSRNAELEKALERRLEALATKIARIKADLEDAGRADDYEKYGNLLMANLHRVPPGAASVTLPDLFVPEGLDVAVPLAPGRLAVDNARDYLKRASKARKGAPVLARRLRATRQEQDELQTLLQRLNELDSEEDLPAFRQELARMGIVRPKAPDRGRRKTNAQDIRPRRYRTSDGWTVLVGRNNQENDRLTKASAKGDIFLHAQGCPGSHVILKAEDKPDRPPRKTLEEAAALAAYWSKARGAKTVPVNATEVRYVHKPRGAKPGLVTIKNEKTLFVSPREIQRAEE